MVQLGRSRPESPFPVAGMLVASRRMPVHDGRAAAWHPGANGGECSLHSRAQSELCSPLPCVSRKSYGCAGTPMTPLMSAGASSKRSLSGFAHRAIQVVHNTADDDEDADESFRSCRCAGPELGQAPVQLHGVLLLPITYQSFTPLIFIIIIVARTVQAGLCARKQESCSLQPCQTDAGAAACAWDLRWHRRRRPTSA